MVLRLYPGQGGLDGLDKYFFGFGILDVFDLYYFIIFQPKKPPLRHLTRIINSQITSQLQDIN